jgi:DNA-binding CsgD family transcriptional regulator
VGKSATVRVEDARAVFRLVGECRESGDDPARWLQRMAAGIAGLLKCNTSTGGEYRVVNHRSVPVVAAYHGYDAIWGRFARWQADPTLPGNPVYKDFEERPDEITAGVEDLIDPAEWEATPYYNELLIPMDMGDTFLSKRFIGSGGSQHYIAVTRPIGDTPFTRREKAVATLFHDTLADQFGTALATSVDPAAALSPRLREVLDCLLDGDSEKAVATKLGLRPASVHDHVKRLYAHFEVNSRAELLAYFLRRYRNSSAP